MEATLGVRAGGEVTAPSAVNEVVVPPPEILIVSGEYVAADKPAFNLTHKMLEAIVPVPVYGMVAEAPNPIVELVVETSKLVEAVIVISPPPEVKLPAVNVMDDPVDGPEP